MCGTTNLDGCARRQDLTNLCRSVSWGWDGNKRLVTSPRPHAHNHAMAALNGNGVCHNIIAQYTGRRKSHIQYGAIRGSARARARTHTPTSSRAKKDALNCQHTVGPWEQLIRSSFDIQPKACDIKCEWQEARRYKSLASQVNMGTCKAAWIVIQTASPVQAYSTLLRNVYKLRHENRQNSLIQSQLQIIISSR